MTSVLPHRPIQDLKQLSVCKAETSALGNWLAQLPAANLGETARLLHTAITEMNRLPLPAEARLALLEKLRPVLHDVLRGLSRHYLNQPLVLPSKARNVAQLAQVLQSGLALGYGLAAEDAKPTRNGASVTGLACHRAIQEYGQVLLRSLSLYQSTPPGTWKALHALYGLAASQRQDRDAVLDPLIPAPRPLSVRQAYLRALLLSCCQSNQLRQHDLRDIYQALGEWVGQADLRPLRDGEHGRVVSPASDGPPLHRALSRADTADLLVIDTVALVRYLSDKSADDTVETLTANGVEIPDNLLAHLARAWGGVLLERHAVRKDSRLTVQVCFGLSALHHHLADGQSLEDLMGTAPAGSLTDTTDKNPFLRQQSSFQNSADLWDSPFKMTQHDSGNADTPGFIDQQIGARSREERAAELQGRFPIVPLVAVNASPDGYGFHWRGELPVALKAGEVLGLRLSENDPWQVAVIRWVKPDEGGAEFGIQVLGHQAQPWGGRAVRKTGDAGDFLRVLLLPATDDCPDSLLTPRVGFRSRQKVVLLQQGELRHVRLARRLDATAAWCRFAFDTMDGLNAAQTPPQTGIGFEALWETL